MAQSAGTGASRGLAGWLEVVIAEPVRQFRWSFLPPLMVYFAAGLSGVSAIVGAFFVKEYLGLSAAFLAGLTFWAGLPWALKMPIGHLVDVIWRWKSLLVYLGAALIAASALIMYTLISDPQRMTAMASMEVWYVLSILLSPIGFVVQDAVADAMSVEAVPQVDQHGEPLDETTSRNMHTTMQTLGRIALISGLVTVAVLNIFMFAGVEQLDQAAKAALYGRVYLLALIIPVVSVTGVLLGQLITRRRRTALRSRGFDDSEIDGLLTGRSSTETKVNHWYFGGGLAFAILTLAVGLSGIRFSQEIVFAGSMAIVLVLMAQLAKQLEPEKAKALFGTAIIIFVFRATPLPGSGLTWFEIDILGFDQQFLSVLSLITSLLTLAGMVVLRPFIARKTIADIVVLLTIAAGFLSLPNIGLYYGVHHWTGPLTGGVVDARFIAVMDTAVESPLGQVAMIPMLAWIARNAPANLKATFFAVMASFTNLALSASSLLTRYLNELFVITREVRDRNTGLVETAADYSMLGWLLIVVAVFAVVAPLVTILIVQHSMLKTSD